MGEEGLTERAVWQLVREYSTQAGIGGLALHDLAGRRRSSAGRRAGSWNKFSFCWGMSRS
jgi:hypothetical protein